MDIVSLREVVDLRAVKYLNSMPKAWWKEILKTDKDRKFEVEYKKVKSFLSGQLDGTGITRQYKFADGKTFGRQFDHSGLQGSGLSFERKKNVGACDREDVLHYWHCEHGRRPARSA